MFHKIKFLIWLISLLYAMESSASATYSLNGIGKGEHKFIYWNELPIFVYRVQNQSGIADIVREHGETFSYAEHVLSTSTMFGVRNTRLFLDASHIDKYPMRSMSGEWIILVAQSAYTGCKLIKLRFKEVLQDPCNLFEYDLTGHSLDINTHEDRLLIPYYKIENDKLIFEVEPSDLSLIKVESLLGDLSNDPRKKFKYLSWLGMEQDALELLISMPQLSGEKGKVSDVFFIASGLGLNNLLEHFLNSGVDVNEMNGTGETALTIAIQMKQKKVIELLLSRGATTSVLCSDDGICTRNPLELAKLYGIDLENFTY